MKYISKIIIITLIITTTLICKENLNKTLAYPYTIKNTTLFYEEDNINIIDNKISLIDYENSYFELPINEVVVEKSNETVTAKVYYDNNSCHLYTFENINNVLKIKNIEVLSWKKQ